MNEKKRVLFVDDNEMDRLILSKTLEQLDLEHKGTKNAEEFLQQIRTYKPDLCLVDLNIEQPNDGRILIRALRNILGNEMPIIVISAVEESSEIALNLKNGANDFVCKPIDRALLSSKIANFLHNDSINSRILPLFRLPTDTVASIEMCIDLSLISFSEQEVIFSSNTTLVPGSVVCLENNFLESVFPELEHFQLKIVKRLGENYQGKILEFKDEDLPKIRLHLTRLQKENKHKDEQV